MTPVRLSRPVAPLAARRAAEDLLASYGQDAPKVANGRLNRALDVGDEAAIGAWTDVVWALQEIGREGAGQPQAPKGRPDP